MSFSRRLRASMMLAAALGAAACDRVPEQALRDEQSRSRKFRDAFENEHDENVALRARVEQLERKSCKPAPVAAEPASR